MESITHCTLCPRRCGANRSVQPGLCGGGALVKVARAAPHHWEEPCISGSRGSGTVFFSGCPLGCTFCQNHPISRQGAGREVTLPQLADIFLTLQRRQVHNLNLVTAGHWRPWAQEALCMARLQGFSLPVVWNTSGYETQQAIAALQGDVDIWLTDLKYYDSQLAQKLAAAPDYFAIASAAVQAMCRQAGQPVFASDGLLRRGVVLRLLVLPGHRQDAENILRWTAENLPPGGFLLSLMSQYTPPPGIALPSPFNRRVSSYEYNKVVELAVALGLTNGFMQQRTSTRTEYTPPFDLTGVPEQE